MAVDKSYGSGYKNSGQSKASALKPGRLKKTAPAVKNAKMYASFKSKSKSTGTAFDIGGRQYMETGVSQAKLINVAKAFAETLGVIGKSATRNRLLTRSTQVRYSLGAKQLGRAAAKKIAQSASTPKMGQQAAQDLYESTTDLVRAGRVSKEIAKSMQEAAYVVPKSKPPVSNYRLESANAGRSIKGSVRPIKKAIPPKQKYTRDDKLNDYFAGYPTRKPRNRGGR
jgi:hypothetical protein